jgi:protein-L-isoaspartate(D-aspartate) O-methyltransferase
MLPNFDPSELLAANAGRREAMISAQIVARGVHDAAVLAAMRALPRELFLPDDLRDQAYEDRALPIGPGQTISQPYIVAYMTEKLSLTRDCVVLEIGTGSGYQAGVLAQLASVVHTVEYDGGLSAVAQRRLVSLGIDNVRFHVGDGSMGLPEFAPFDRVMVTAACPDAPRVLVDQLAMGGIAVLPVGDEESQTLVRIEKRESGTVETSLLQCRFVKLLGKYGWHG